MSCVFELLEVSGHDNNDFIFDTNFHKTIFLKCGSNKDKGELLQFTKSDMRHFEMLTEERKSQ